MTIDEAIRHAEEVAELHDSRCEYYKDHDMDEYIPASCKCAEEHKQLAEWLKDYKRLKERQPYEKFESTKDHIYKLAGDYKCWDNRLTEDEAVELCHILEQQSMPTMIYPQVDGITPTVVNEDIYECSCGYGWDKNKVLRFHFCPNCGKAVDDGNDYKYIESISNPTGIEFDIDIPKEIESYGKLLKHPVVKHIMGFDEEQEQIDFVRPHKRIPVTLTVSDDLISRKALISHIENQSRKWGEDYDAQQILGDIEDMPSVKPQTGYWIDREEYDADRWECSECGRTEQYKENYCPSCGARMESEKNE